MSLALSRPAAVCTPPAIKRRLTVIIKLLTLISGVGLHSPALQGEPEHSPVASAILQIKVPLIKRGAGGTIHVWEACSGTLVDRHRGMVLTAWHCFDGAMDLTRPALALVGDRWQPLRLGQMGGAMKQDWAVTFLTEPVEPDQTALPVSPAAVKVGDPVTMLGFQLSQVDGPAGARVLVRTHCNVTGIGQHWTESNCKLAKGASGGAVIIGNGARASLVGIVSAQKDDHGVMFIPASRLTHYVSPP